MREQMGPVLRWAAASIVTCGLLAGGGVALANTATRGGASVSQVFTVNVDGVNAKANETFVAYFPRSSTVHPGDSVVFHYVGVGEPHTVTLGSLADRAVGLFVDLTPKQQQQGPPPPALLAADAALPQLLPSGPGDATASAANPCYLRSGLPGTALCPRSQHEQPAFDGSQSFYNSGWLDANQRWTVHISSATPPGTYRFICLLHREFMNGKVTVVPSDKAIASPSEQYALGQKQQAGMEAALAPAVTALRQGKPPVAKAALPANSALAGSAAMVPAQIDEFGPKTIKIPVGGSVTWYFLGAHTITFNSDKTNNDIRFNAPDGTTHINPKAAAPAGGPGEPPPAKNGPTSGIHLKVVATSTWNGHGFHSSGVFANSFGPPLIEGYRLTFTKAGTYTYICTVHDHMKGQVVVG
jgi:plastocyanin